MRTFNRRRPSRNCLHRQSFNKSTQNFLLVRTTGDRPGSSFTSMGLDVPAGDAIVGEAANPNGIRVVLLARIWHDKVSVDHPEIAMLADDVLNTVASPDHVEADPARRGRDRYYSRSISPSEWLVVVVSYEQAPARIISAFAKRKDPPSWSK